MKSHVAFHSTAGLTAYALSVSFKSEERGKENTYLHAEHEGAYLL